MGKVLHTTLATGENPTGTQNPSIATVRLHAAGLFQTVQFASYNLFLRYRCELFPEASGNSAQVTIRPAVGVPSPLVVERTCVFHQDVAASRNRMTPLMMRSDSGTFAYSK